MEKYSQLNDETHTIKMKLSLVLVLVAVCIIVSEVNYKRSPVGH